MFSKRAEILAEISLRLWLKCRQIGHPCSVHLSYNAQRGSLSRYLTNRNFTIRLSDHPHNDDRKWDHQLIVLENDKLEDKWQEALKLLAGLLGEGALAGS